MGQIEAGLDCTFLEGKVGSLSFDMWFFSTMLLLEELLKMKYMHHGEGQGSELRLSGSNPDSTTYFGEG